MKTSVFYLALLLVCVMSACQQQNGSSNLNSPSPTATVASDRLTPDRIASIRQAVTAVQEQSTKALTSNDPAVVPEAFSAEFSTAGGDYAFESRDALVRGLKSGELKFGAISTEVSDVKVPNATTAIVTGKRAVKATIRGKEFDYTYQLKAVYTLEDGKWKALLWAVGGC